MLRRAIGLRARYSLLLASLIGATLSPILTADCNQRRAEIRFATDVRAAYIETAAVVTTVEALHAEWTKRTDEKSAGPARHTPEETTVYQVDAILDHFEGDWDRIDPNAHYILTFSSLEGDRAMQGELVAPGCAERSPLIQEITEAHWAFDSVFVNKPYERKSPRYELPVRVTGVGFLETGYGWRTLRLSPITRLEFNPPDFGKLKVPENASRKMAAGVGAAAVEMSAEPDNAEKTPGKRSRVWLLIPFLVVAGAAGAVVLLRMRR